MGKDCQFCGTSVFIPSSGAIVLNHNSLDTVEDQLDLTIQHKDTDAIIYTYESNQELFYALEALFQNNTPDYWLHILNLETSQSFPIAVQHLYERLKHPKLSSIIQNGNFSSHLQPIVNMETNDIYGYESLLRTSDQAVNPGDLFSYAHRSGLHSMLDQKARRAAVKAKSNHLDSGRKIFINFLPSTIYVPEFCLKHTFQIVEEFNINPADLVFEVVETERITDIKHLKSILETYQASGMKVALDDVGAGYSTLEMLSLLQPDFLKIDRAYVKECHQRAENQHFLYQVMQRARELNIYVLAEGIETKEEWDWLKRLGVDYGQGYFIGKPQPEPVRELILP